MPVVCVLNQKGGVGKTSTCFHLSATLAQRGRRVLLVDNDPQASLTQNFHGPDGLLAFPPATTIAGILAGEDPLPAQVIRSVLPGVDLVPGSEAAASYNQADPHLGKGGDPFCLRGFLSEVSDDYDYVLIDCTPTLYFCAWVSLIAADHLIIPLNPEDSGAQGIGKVLECVGRVQAGPHPGLGHPWYLITRSVPRSSLHQYYEESLRGLYKDSVLTTVVPHLLAYPEATSERKPVGVHKPKGAAAKVMKALAEELEARVAVRMKGVA
jgi:chromosome partitioning protein